VPPVAKYFPDAVALTETDIGMAVQKGNPHGIHTLADLATPGLRVGICNSQQSTLGFITRGLLRSVDLVTNVQKNVVVEVPTADFLINQLRAGALDAVVVYKVNAIAQSAHLDYLPLERAPASAGGTTRPSKAPPSRCPRGCWPMMAVPITPRRESARL